MKALIPLLLACLSGVTLAQMPAQPLQKVTPLTEDTFNLDWEGISGRTYFIQYSFDLMDWSYMPVIESGAGVPLGYGFECDGERMFLRLKYTDQSTNSPHSDDFDGDTISNWDEIREGGTGTDPFLEDSNNDGIRDDGLVYAAVNDPDGAHLTPSLTNGLRARWDIQPTAGNTTTYQDTSGNNRHLTRNSLVATTTSEAIISQSCQLFGGYLSADSAVTDDLLEYSLSFWMKPEKDSLSGASANLNRTLWSYSSTSTLPPMLALMLRNEKTIELRQYTSPAAWVGLGTWTAPDKLDDDRWRHLALVRRPGLGGTRYHLFINGQEIGNDWGGGSNRLAHTSTGYIRFGASNYFPNIQTFPGHLDRILLHDRGLTDNEVQSLYRADIDQDGLWDITEHRTNLWRDLNADNIRQPSEYNRWLSPYHQDDPAEDHDNDGVSSEDEQNNHGTDPSHPDSDGDLLPDGWELVHGLDPNNSNDATAHLKSLYVYDADPNDPDSDTDGDGTTDIVEINGPDGDPDTPDGSHPNDARDGGQPIPSDERLLINLGVGDKSYSHSEDYVLHVYRIDPVTGQEKRYYTLRSGGHGQYDEKVVGVFRQEDTYTFQIDWQSSNLAYSADPGNPDGADFDYSFKVEPQNDSSGVWLDSYDPRNLSVDTGNPVRGDNNNVNDFLGSVEPVRVVRMAINVKWVAIPGFDNVDKHFDPWSNSENGNRIFPGYKNPDEVDNIQHKLTLEVSGGIEGIKVFLSAFDVDDSTSTAFDIDLDSGTAIIDTNGNGGFDNIPGVYEVPKTGQFWTNGTWGNNTAGGIFSTNGKYSVDFRVGMQPGNNYRVVVAIDNINPLHGVQATDSTIAKYIGYLPQHNGGGIASPTLTVWRKLWVENDSMKAIPVVSGFKSNQVEDGIGTVLEAVLQENGNTLLTLGAWGDSPQEGDLENGQIQVDTTRHKILSVETEIYNLALHRAVEIAGDQTSLDGKAFRLYDDDDFGLIDEPLPRLDLVDETMKNVYKTAFIQVVNAVDYNPRKTIEFYRNHPAVVGFVPDLFGGEPGVYDDAIDLASSNGLWVGNLIAGYQADPDLDHDPNSQNSDEGGTPENTRRYSVVFVEAVRDEQDLLLRNPIAPHAEIRAEIDRNIKFTAAHELGHMPGGSNGDAHHLEYGLMGAGGYSSGDHYFTPSSIKRFRNTSNWQQSQ